VLAALLVAGFAWPRWRLSGGPIAVTIALTGYRLTVSRGSTEDAIALVGVLLLALAMQAALVLGALTRAAVERARQRPERARAAARAAAEIALAGVVFLGTLAAMARGSSAVFALMAVAAVGVVLARMWRTRLGGAPRFVRSASGTPMAPARRSTTTAAAARRRPRTRRGQPRSARVRRL